MKCWLIEANDNPSLNVYVDKELPNGDIEQTLCELDKYVKAMLISDTIKMMTQQSEDEEILEFGSLKRILPSDNSYYLQFQIYSDAELIFEKLLGTKSSDFINSSQF